MTNVLAKEIEIVIIILVFIHPPLYLFSDVDFAVKKAKKPKIKKQPSHHTPQAILARSVCIVGLSLFLLLSLVVYKLISVCS